MSDLAFPVRSDHWQLIGQFWWLVVPGKPLQIQAIRKMTAIHFLYFFIQASVRSDGGRI